MIGNLDVSLNEEERAIMMQGVALLLAPELDGSTATEERVVDYLVTTLLLSQLGAGDGRPIIQLPSASSMAIWTAIECGRQLEQADQAAREQGQS